MGEIEKGWVGNDLIKVFISQPFSGVSEAERVKKREGLSRLAREVIGEDIEVLTNYDKSDDKSALYGIGENIKIMADADVVVIPKDYLNYRGCKIERYCAKQYGKRIIKEQ